MQKLGKKQNHLKLYRDIVVLHVERGEKLFHSLLEKNMYEMNSLFCKKNYTDDGRGKTLTITPENEIDL